MMNPIKKFIQQWTKSDLIEPSEPKPTPHMLYEAQQEHFEHDMSILGDDDGLGDERLQKQAEQEVRVAAEGSLKELHVIKHGRCPKCGAHLHQHLFSSICDDCGWHLFEAPKNGSVRVHLKGGADCIEGESCYIVKAGAVLVIRNDVIFAKIPAASVSWIEYNWKPKEIEQRRRSIMHKLNIPCGWCGGAVDIEKEGFHLTHIAFGATQERFCFCSDECYEAFRKLYPARVHRNCYERDCVDCDLCDKRYPEGGDGIYTFMKDYLIAPSRKMEK